MVEAAGGTTTRLLWCGEAICQSRDAADSPRTYLYPQGELRGTQRLYYATDHLGSVREVRDPATGQTVAARDYSPYGATTAQAGSLAPARGFAGMWRHAPTGLYLTHYRAYSAQYGRWLNRDPIFEAGGVSLYAYVGGNPVNYVDPQGLVNTDPTSPFGPWGLEGARGGGGGGVGPAARLVGGRYSTTTQGSIREITGRGRMTDMSGSARVTFDRFRGDTPANCSTTASGGAREVARLPNGTVVQLRDGRVDIFPPGGSPETIHFPGP